MKALTLALMTAAGLALTAGAADAQYRYHSTYVTPTYYSYPSYSYPSYGYATPSYYSGSVGIVPAGGYVIPPIAPTIYPNGSYSPTTWAPTYTSYSYPMSYGYGYSYGSRGRGWRR